jgi:hypothetical protein
VDTAHPPCTCKERWLSFGNCVTTLTQLIKKIEPVASMLEEDDVGLSPEDQAYEDYVREYEHVYKPES